MKKEAWGIAAMGGGLMLFGLAVGGIAGLSKTPVASGLLTSIFGFVGGVLLSFAGFTIADTKGGGAKPRVNTLAMGVALAAFSLGLSGGVVGGLLARFHHPGIVEAEVSSDGKSANNATRAPEKKSVYRFGLEDKVETVCASVEKEIAGKQYAADPTLAPARVTQLHEILCAPTN